MHLTITIPPAQLRDVLPSERELAQAEWERTHLPPDVAALLKRRRDTANGAANVVTVEANK